LLLENVDAEETKSIFESNFSHIYYILYDTFVTAETNLRQRGTVKYFSQFDILLWEDNFKIDHREMGFWGMDWIYLAQDRDWWWAIVDVIMNLWVP
jgi:hypothetical protein